MSETREVHDSFIGQTVKIDNDLVRRLRGQYAVGPTLPNGEPEFGWRKFAETPPIQLEAADEIEWLRSMLTHIANQDYDSGYSAEDFARHALDPKFDEGDVI